MTEAATYDIDAQGILDDLIAERGGLSKFDRHQIETAREITDLMIEMRYAPRSEKVKYGDTIGRLKQDLPPVVPVPRKSTFPSMPGMSLNELALEYQRAIADLDGDPDWDRVPIIGAAAGPPADAAAPPQKPTVDASADVPAKPASGALMWTRLRRSPI
jgi:hypothetical protein